MDTREELIKLKEKDWYMGKRQMPDYLLRLMVYKAEMEKLSLGHKEK